jgi:hypothetical protein
VTRRILPFGTPKERPAAPLPGYKLAHPIMSADGTRAGFTGITIGRSSMYGVTADAECAQGARHKSPSRWCDCGFYCVHSLDEARALSFDPDYRYAVMLEIVASGRFMRYERGLRYARQRVVAVRVGYCGCDRLATTFVRIAHVAPGWHRLAAACLACAGNRPAVSFGEFARLLGGPPVTSDHSTLRPWDRPGAEADLPPDEAERAELVPVLCAEAALLQARLDELQRQLARLTGGQ